MGNKWLWIMLGVIVLLGIGVFVGWKWAAAVTST